MASLLTLVWSLIREHVLDGEVWRRMDSVLFSDLGGVAMEAMAGWKCWNLARMVDCALVFWQKRVARYAGSTSKPHAAEIVLLKLKCVKSLEIYKKPRTVCGHSLTTLPVC